MPNRDKTGPEGQGPKTGRGLGNCRQNNPDGSEDSTQFGAGMGQGRRAGDGGKGSGGGGRGQGGGGRGLGRGSGGRGRQGRR